MTWEKELLKQAGVAFDTGQELTFSVIKRQGQRQWRISLKRLVNNGEEKVEEED